MTIDEALRFLGLSPFKIDEAALMNAYRKCAKEFHPDSAKNFKEKAASVDKLSAAIDARNQLREALRNGELPRKKLSASPEAGSTEKEDPSSSGAPRRSEPQWQRNPFISTERNWHDHHHPPPFQRAMGIPMFGPVLGFAWILGVIATLAGTLTIAWPFVIMVAVLAMFLGEDIRGKLKAKAVNLLGYLQGLPMLALFYVTSAAGIYIWASGDEDRFFFATALAWFSISCFALDEIYSLIRYLVFLRPKAKRALTILFEE